MLYIIPTPIGNLEDITMRAIKVLKECDFVLAEDTRVSKKLFSHYDIDTPLKAFHAHNEHKQLQSILETLEAGQIVGLISDAGTPGISDPGFLLSRACVEAGIQLECLPGATALIPAIVASGLPCDRFHFEGFLPQKKGRQTRLKYLASLNHTFVLYESPHRLIKCLKQLIEHCGADRMAFVGRELTKMYEEKMTANLEELLTHFESKDKIKGELVLVVGEQKNGKVPKSIKKNFPSD